MDEIEVEGVYGPLKHLVTSAWKVDDATYRIIIDNPRLGKFIVITVDVRDLIREAALVN